MQTQLIVLNVWNDVTRWVWSASCAAILYFFGAACFYHGSWRAVGLAILIASALYIVTSLFDGLMNKLTKKWEARDLEYPARGRLHLV